MTRPPSGRRARTRDLNLGKVALYQLSYVRLRPRFPRGDVTIAEWRLSQTRGIPRGSGTVTGPGRPVRTG